MISDGCCRVKICMVESRLVTLFSGNVAFNTLEKVNLGNVGGGGGPRNLRGHGSNRQFKLIYPPSAVKISHFKAQSWILVVSHLKLKDNLGGTSI